MEEELKTYYVESWARWYLVDATNKRAAYSDGVKEFGRGSVKSVRLATKEERKYYLNLRLTIDKAQ